MAKYSYLANGSKSKAENGSGVGLVYRGSLIYKKAANGTLTFEGASIPEGRLVSGGVRYYVTDHLGSVKAVVNGMNGNLYEVNDYEVYGKRTANSSASSYLSNAPSGEVFRDRFTGKEDQGPDFGTAYTDFGARQFSPNLRRWLVPDPLSEKYYGVSPYAYCAGNPVNMVDDDGMKVRIKDNASLEAIYNGLLDKGVQIKIDEEGNLDPSSLIKDSDDFFMRDLYELASNNDYLIEISVADKYRAMNLNGETGSFVVSKDAPYDDDDNLTNGSASFVVLEGVPWGRHIQGNTGRSLFPVPSDSQSTDNNIHVIINEKGNLNHRTVGMAHEFGHVVLFLRKQPYRHGDQGVDSFVYYRAGEMSKRLGYDY